MNAFRKSFEGHARRRLNSFKTSFEDSKIALLLEQKKKTKTPTWHFLSNNVILEQCKRVYCVDLGESFQTHIYLQNSASIQPRTSPVKFARSPNECSSPADRAAPSLTAKENLSASAADVAPSMKMT